MRLLKEIRPPGWVPPEITDHYGLRLKKLISMVEDLIRSKQEELGIEVIEVSSHAVPVVKHEYYLLQGMIVSCIDKETGNFTYLNIDIDSPSEKTPVVEEKELPAHEKGGPLQVGDGQVG
jgi:hypothetical protein